MSNEPAIELKDVIHLYLGCEFIYKVGPKIWNGWSGFRNGEGWELNKDEWCIVMGAHCFKLQHIKLVLRKLDSMTGEEQKELDATKFFQRATPVHVIGSMVWTAESFRWALSKGFDLFNLIENNVAIDKNKAP